MLVERRGTETASQLGKRIDGHGGGGAPIWAFGGTGSTRRSARLWDRLPLKAFVYWGASGGLRRGYLLACVLH
jgi:hypothetical protein